MAKSAGHADISESRALKLLKDLLRIDGVSCAEKDVADFVVESLRGAGVPASWIHRDDAHKRSERGGACGNVICRFPGTMRGDGRLFSAHMDTVPNCAGAWPKREGDVLVSGNPNAGLGADDRAGVATVLNTALEIRRRKLAHPPLTFLFLVQEEIGLVGAKLVDVKRLGRPKLCFNFDAGDPARIMVGATGSSRMEILLEGKASHAGASPDKGISAVAVAGLAIADLQTNGWIGRVRKGRREGTSNVVVAEGGGATNVVPDRARLRVNVRSHETSFRKRITDEYRKACERALRQVRNVDGERGRGHYEVATSFEAYRLGPDDPAVAAARESIESLGRAAELAVTYSGYDASALTARGLPSVTLGSGQTGAHTLGARVILGHFYDGCRLAMKLAAPPA